MSCSSSRSWFGCSPAAGRSGTSGSSGSLTRRAAESIRTPATPRSNQNRRISSCSRRTSGWFQLRSGCSGLKRWRYHSPGVPSASVVRVQVSPEKLETQFVGISSPCSPRPGRNQNRSRSGEPGPAASAAWNQGCWSETWFGTTSMIVRIPSARASAISASASARSPKAGWMRR